MGDDALVSIDASPLAKTADDLAEAIRRIGRSGAADNKVIAERISEMLRTAAQQGTRAERHFAGQIQAQSSSSWARIAISADGAPGAVGTFAGSLRWKQFRRWVGSNWVLGVPGEGPYVVRDVYPKNVDEIGAWYLEARARDLGAVFPNNAPSGPGR